MNPISIITCGVGIIGCVVDVAVLSGSAACNKITLDVTAGDTIYAKASWLTDSDTATSKCAQGYVVLTIIEHD